MNIAFVLSAAMYVSILVIVGLVFYFKQKNAADFMVGGRSVNFWVTAIATHATDMSAWLFMAFPGLVYRDGLFGPFWIAVGLVVCMFLTWQYIAPKIRIMTERENTPTLPSYFEKRFNDRTGILRTLSALICVVFFTFYISAGIVALGRTIQMTFSMSYFASIFWGTLVMALYTLLGGFIAIAWNDFMQGMFVLAILILVPIFACVDVGGVNSVIAAVKSSNVSLTILPNFSLAALGSLLVAMFSWGIGYFGLPHILVNFMGIDKVEDLKKSQYMGIAWQILTLAFAMIIGFIGIAYFADKTFPGSELVFIGMAKNLFPPLIAGFVLCAILAAAMTTMDSQILVSASIIAQDFYKRLFNKNITPKKLLVVSQFAGLGVTIISFLLALNNNSRILDLVYYAWAGLGASFGPLVITCFYSRWVTRNGAVAGIITGAVTSAVWPQLGLPLADSQIIPAFILSFVAIYVVSKLSRK